MKKSQLLKTICICATLFICAPSNAALIAGASPGISVLDLGSGPGFTNIEVDITDINGGTLAFNTLGSIQDNFTISIINSTATPWDNIKFDFSANILSPIGIIPTTGTIVGIDLTLNTALLYFNPPETTSLLNGSGILDTSDGGFFLVITPNATVVPVPATVWLFGSGLLGLIGVARRKARA